MRAPYSLLLCAFLAAGCGSATLHTSDAFRSLTVGGTARRVVSLTDVDTVRDMAATTSELYVATDRGVLVYALDGDTTPRRVTKAEGLPSNDVRVVAVAPDGSALVATSEGLAQVAGTSVNPAFAAPPVGPIRDLAVRDDGSILACGQAGLARWSQGAWSGFGEPCDCTKLVKDGANVWVGTTTGLLEIEGDDVVREHSQSRGIPEPYVQDIAPLPGGQVMALLRGPTRSMLGFFDGHHWYGYTIDAFDPPAAALFELDHKVLLLTPGHAFTITPGRGAGVPLVALNASTLVGVRGYRARVTPRDRMPDWAGQPAPLRAPAKLVEVPVGQPTIDAPPLQAEVSSMQVPQDAYLGMVHEGMVFLADHNRGIAQLSGGRLSRTLRTNDLVVESTGADGNEPVGGVHLQVAYDDQQHTFLLSRAGDLAMMDDEGVLRRVPLPDGLRAQAIATGPDGAYLAAFVGDTQTVRIYRGAHSHWEQAMERALVTPTHLVHIPFMGVDATKNVWLALEVEREEGAGSGTRMRGAAMLSSTAETIVYHHRGATSATDGEGATPLQDEITAMDFTEQGAWFATLAGAVRVGGSQAVVFGESRGVRGEVVSDLATAPGNRVWVASAEGVGQYADGHFDFTFPALVQSARPTTLAVDAQANLWAAGQHGVVYYDGHTWQQLTHQTGLPTDDVKDVEVDAHGRAFLLTEDEVLLFSAAE